MSAAWRINVKCRWVALLGFLALAATLVAAIPRPEHPRPDAFRESWVSLNGEWQFEIDEQGNGNVRGLSTGKDLAAKITVPFAPESKLSGVGHYGLMKHTWYRRHFEVPNNLKGKRLLLHFGAIDYQAWVWVNGQLAGSHIGGSVAFHFDVTRMVKDGTNEVVVRAFDDTASGRQPTGKQTHTVSEGCVYTRTTGIWQPVWLEAVGTTFVDSISIVPDPDQSRVLIEAGVNGNDKDLQLTAEAWADGKLAGHVSCPVAWRNHRLVIDLNKKVLWEPGAPFLYDLKLTLTRKGTPVDQVSSYFGLRKVSIEGRSILINGKRVFQRLILDQGFYPDGIWTAPSDDELRKDIERSMAAGFNGARLHQKVFEPRFLYWADKLGYLVWGEFPNWGYGFRSESHPNYINEWTEILLRDRNHPSIVGWCPFNETPAAAGELQNLVVRQTRVIDPTRPVFETSGWTHTMKDAEVRDDHDYNQDPATFKQRWEDFFAGTQGLQVPARYPTSNSSREELGVPFMVSEFGGTVWGKADGGWGYGSGPKTLDEFYQRYEGLVSALLDNPNLFGFCYTQLTDVEQEQNGLFYYDRRPKFDLERLHAITSRPAAYEKTGPSAPAPVAAPVKNWNVLVGARVDEGKSQPYRFTLTAPATNWMIEAFSDKNWQVSQAPFGNELPNVLTPWNTSDIWLRQQFVADDAGLKTAALVIFYDEDTEVFVNGQLIWKRSGFSTAYNVFDVTENLKRALKKGRNTLAVHTHQTGGGQFIDLALLVEPLAPELAGNKNR